MDSAYQSQSGASRRGQEYQSSPIQESSNHMSSFMAHGISPSLASDSFIPFSDSQDMSHVTQVASAGLDFGTGSHWFTNHSAGQDLSPYSPSVARPLQSNSMTGAFTWNTNDVSPFTYTPSMTPFNMTNEPDVFQPQASSQPQLSRPRLENSARQSHSSSEMLFATEHNFNQAARQSSGARASVVSPAPTQSLQAQAFTESGFDSSQLLQLG